MSLIPHLTCWNILAGVLTSGLAQWTSSYHCTHFHCPEKYWGMHFCSIQSVFISHVCPSQTPDVPRATMVCAQWKGGQKKSNCKATTLLTDLLSMTSTKGIFMLKSHGESASEYPLGGLSYHWASPAVNLHMSLTIYHKWQEQNINQVFQRKPMRTHGTHRLHKRSFLIQEVTIQLFKKKSRKVIWGIF